MPNRKLETQYAQMALQLARAQGSLTTALLKCNTYLALASAQQESIMEIYRITNDLIGQFDDEDTDDPILQNLIAIRAICEQSNDARVAASDNGNSKDRWE